MKRLKYVFFIFLLLVEVDVFAQQGCAESNTGNPNIHPDRIGVSARFTPDVLTRNNVTQPSPQCNDYYKSYVVIGSYGSCRWNWISYTNSSAVLNSQGYLVDYVLNCPLDDFIWLLLLPLSGLGFYYLRGRSLSQLLVL